VNSGLHKGPTVQHDLSTDRKESDRTDVEAGRKGGKEVRIMDFRILEYDV